jgi:hypothetical protein
MAALRADLVFSYWIYFWYVLYAFKVTNYSPKFPLILGVIDNLIMFVLMLLYGTSSRTIFYFIIINTLIKVVPLYYLRNQSIKINDIEQFTNFINNANNIKVDINLYNLFLFIFIGIIIILLCDQITKLAIIVANKNI